MTEAMQTYYEKKYGIRTHLLPHTIREQNTLLATPQRADMPAPTVALYTLTAMAVTVSDGRGGTATQSYIVTVLPDPANHPPIIISEPVTTALAGRPEVLYVANSGDNTIGRFTSNGTDLGSFPAGGIEPIGLAFDGNGILYVSLYLDNVIRKFSPDGIDLGIFADTGLANPAGMVFDSSGNLYVVNYNYPSVQSFVRAFSPTGADLGVFIAGSGWIT
jgi:sugar lactone lactonase YvrE